MKYVFCVDLDGTLKTEVDFNVKKTLKSTSDIIKVKIDKVYEMIPRNGIKDFLNIAKKKGKVYMTTGGTTEYGEKIAFGLGIRNLFDEIVGFDRMIAQDWPILDGKIIWIDNDPIILDKKIKNLPLNKNTKNMEKWIISTFMGIEDQTMQELVQEINKL